MTARTKIYGINFTGDLSINPQVLLSSDGKKDKKNSSGRGLSHRFGIFFLYFFYFFAGVFGFCADSYTFFVFSSY